jgi:hypothetical protein
MGVQRNALSCIDGGNVVRFNWAAGYKLERTRFIVQRRARLSSYKIYGALRVVG